MRKRQKKKNMQNGKLCCPTRVPKSDLGILGLAFQKYTDLPLAALLSQFSPPNSQNYKERDMGWRADSDEGKPLSESSLLPT